VITVLLVRHADVDLPPEGADPGLNEAGLERAAALAHVVVAAGVSAVLTSGFARTKQTAAPVLAALGIGGRVMPDPAVVAAQVRAGVLGGVVLVVGHSNTVPGVIEALGVVGPAPAIGEREFDNLFVVTLGEPAGATLLTLRYGVI
jgi:phosphohistidine phosphatase SixA